MLLLMLMKLIVSVYNVMMVMLLIIHMNHLKHTNVSELLIVKELLGLMEMTLINKTVVNVYLKMLLDKVYIDNKDTEINIVHVV